MRSPTSWQTRPSQQGYLRPDARQDTVGVSSKSATPAYTAPAPIAPDHQIENFDSGNPSLDHWLKEHALDKEGRVSRSYVVKANGGPQTGQVIGYYTLATLGGSRSAKQAASSLTTCPTPSR